MSEARSQLEIGTLAWARATDGSLTAAERRRLLAPMLRTTVDYVAGRLRYALGLRPARLAQLDLARLRWPDTQMAREAERACRESVTVAMANHSYRTFVFGLALAQLDAVTVDEEDLYVTALLHDIALESPVPSRCFAARGAETALELLAAAGASPERARLIAEAIALHITPGVDFSHGPLAPLIAAGAMVDLVGLRLHEVDSALVRDAFERFPRADVRRHLASCWRSEARAVPRGRAAAAERLARFSLIVRLAPFSE